MQWQLETEQIPETQDELQKLLLEQRKIKDLDSFFEPPKPETLDPAEIGIAAEQLTKAVELIQAAVDEKKTIVIFGDYDADGICATAILWLALKKIGCIAQPFIPKRDVHGYGLSIAAVEEVIETHKPNLIITVDNGIVAHEAAQFVREQGIQLIITDHHQLEKSDAGESVTPSADAVVHTTQLCGTTVSWMLSQAVTKDATELLDLCGIATIADQVPLLGANRAFATHGILALRKTKRPGLLALFATAKVVQKEITEQSIGYGIAPRINAMGRLAHGMDALRLLCTGQDSTAQKLAHQLQSTNVERQDITQEQLDMALTQVEVQAEESIVIAHSDEFHEGVIGLIAGRLVEVHAKPAVVISTGGEIMKGSARSVQGVNITDLLRSVREELLDVGGHPMAGGCSVKPGRLAEFAEKLFAVAREQVTAEMLLPTLRIACHLPPALLTQETVATVEQFAPFGSNNERPTFQLPTAVVLSAQTIGKEQQHLKLLIECQDTDQPLEALWWRAGDTLQEFVVGSTVSVAGRLEISEWKRRKKLQVVVQDVQTTIE